MHLKLRNLSVVCSSYSGNTIQCACAHCRDGELSAEETEDMRRLMEAVPGLKQRIAGKSLPMEKFAIR